MTTFPGMRRWLVRGAAGLLMLAVALVGAGQLGLLAGRPPAELGVHDGRLKAPSATPNSVSSQAWLHPGHPMRQSAQIDALPLGGTDAAPLQRLARLAEVVASMPGAHIVERRPDYLYATFRSRWLGFVDDVEFWSDGTQVQVRSASRLGSGDLGVNRARIETIRERLRTPR